MTIASQTSRIGYTGDGSTTAFSVPYFFLLNTDIVVAVQDLSGNVTIKALGTDYNMTGSGVSSGGTCTFTAAPTTGFLIAIYRVPPMTQLASYNNNDPFPAKSHEAALDKTATIDQYLYSLMQRAILVAPTDTPPMTTLPPASVRALKNLSFDGLGNPSVSTPVTGTAVSSVMAPVVAGSTLAIARTALGISDPSAARSNLQAIDTTKITTTYLTEAGRSGEFVWRTGNYASLVTADPQQGIYIAANGIATTVGAWVRVRTEGAYNVKWFGAFGDNSTNDYTAIQAAINLCETEAGGDVIFSQGAYRCDTGLVINTALVRLIGVGQKRSSLFTNVANVNLITISAARCSVQNLSIFEQVQCGTASALITLASGAVQCVFEDLDMVGGYYCFRALAGSADNVCTNSVMRLATGGAIVYSLGSGTMFFKRCLFNQGWPVATPASTNDKGARTNNTAYVANDFVTLGGFYLQCSVGGTSSSAPPSLTGIWYGAPIVDGGVTWYIANNAAGVAVLVDSASTYFTMEDCDMTGAFNYGFQQANNLGTTAPDVTRIVRCTTGGFQLHGFFISSANRLLVLDCEIQSPVGNSSSNVGIYLNSSVAGDITLRGNQITTNFDYGIWLDKSTTLGSALIEGNTILGMTGTAINVSAAVKDFQIINNNVGGSSTWGNNAFAITVMTGASDHYVIANNRVHGATTGVSDGGSGSNKTVSGNVV